MKRPLLSATALAAIMQFAATHEAAASGFMVRENSAESLATAYGGNGSRADEASTVFNNPAGMMHLQGDEVQLGTGVVFPSIRFNGSATVLGTAIPGNNGGNGGQFTGIPHLYGVFTINDRLKAGLAITAPFGNTVNYDPNWAGRYVGVKTAALSVDINPNLAYRVNDWLSVGGGISAQWFKLEASSTIAQFLILGPTAPDAVYLFKGDDWAFGYNLGLLAEPSADTRIGLTYRSKVEHNPKGTLNFTGASPLLGLISGPATAHDLNLPATIGLSLTRDVTPSWSLGADIQFNQWSSLKQITITSANAPVVNVEGYEDSWMVSLGAAYRADDRLTLRGGLAWDQTPVGDNVRTVGVPDADRYVVGLGFGYRLTDSTSVDGAYSHYFSAEHGSMNSSVNNTDPITHAVVLHGKYTNGLDYLAISVRHKL
jgi:long-chain fatty acid transport protein